MMPFLRSGTHRHAHLLSQPPSLAFGAVESVYRRDWTRSDRALDRDPRGYHRDWRQWLEAPGLIENCDGMFDVKMTYSGVGMKHR